MKKGCLLFIFSCISFGAWCRNPEGLLDIIITPNDGIPVLLQAGSHFEVVTTEEGELKLRQGDAAFSLVSEWTNLPGGRFQAVCSVPEPISEGCYALECTTATRTDVNTRSVFVVDSFPETYSIVHLTDVHIGSNRYPKPSEQIFRELVTAVEQKCAEVKKAWYHENDITSESDDDKQTRIPPVAFVVLTGDLTESGELSQFRTFLEILGGLRLPTYVCAGNHDRKELNYERVFGPLTYAFTIGEDGYLSFDTKDYLIADDAGVQDSYLERYRQSIMASRWAIGLTHRYDPMMGMRTQLTLFVDNPLDLLLYGHVHRENAPEEQRVPWGTTPIIITPAAIDGAYRLVVIDANRITPLAVERPVSVR